MTCSRIQANKQCIKTHNIVSCSPRKWGVHKRSFTHFAKIAITHICTLQSGLNLAHIWGSKGKYKYQIWGDLINNEGIISDYCIKQSQTSITPTE